MKPGKVNTLSLITESCTGCHSLGGRVQSAMIQATGTGHQIVAIFVNGDFSRRYPAKRRASRASNDSTKPLFGKFKEVTAEYQALLLQEGGRFGWARDAPIGA